MTQLDTLLELGELYARGVLLEHRQKTLMPTYHLIGKDNRHVVLHCPWQNTLQKQIHFALVKKKAQEIVCRAAVFVSEGWSVNRLTQDTVGVIPSEADDRIEVVHITAIDTTGAASIILHMVRDLSPGMNERLIALEPMGRLDNAEGRMIDDLIQPQERSH